MYSPIDFAAELAQAANEACVSDHRSFMCEWFCARI